jgi:hypothetical protein
MGHPADPTSVHVCSGALRFARYALAPNRLGYCGPTDSEALFEQAVALRSTLPVARQSASPVPPAGTDEVVGGLRDLASGFEGAWPYLELIAEANGIGDPLDDRVVSAYWLGGRALQRVSPVAAGNHATSRFRSRAGARWPHVLAALEPGASPSHAFHVMVVGPWIGMLRGGLTDAPLTVIDSCRIRRAKVLSTDGDTAVVSTDRVTFHGGRLGIQQEVEPNVLEVRLGEGGVHPCGPVAPGDVVSVHWDWVCEVLDDRTNAAVGLAEKRALSRANLALGQSSSPELG